MSVFRRKKILIVLILSLMAFLFLQHFSAKATWKNSIMMKLRQYQIELEQTIDFSQIESSSNESTFSPGNLIRKKNHLQPLELVQSDVKSLDGINELFKHSRNCLSKSKHQIAIYLHKVFESEFSNEYSFKKNTSPILKPTCKPGLDLIIILTTRPGAFYSRVAIRNAWGRRDSQINKHIFHGTNFHYKTIFTIGRDDDSKIEKLIEDENEYFKDILRLDYPDTYENLPDKTILSLDWIGRNCRPKYVLKTDDDCFVNILSLSKWLPNINPETKYIGKKNDYMPVIRDPLHRNYVPFEDFGEEFYKPYCAGGGYMLAGDIILNITTASKNIKQIINEDAYVGMAANSINIEPVDDERFLPFIFSKKNVNKRFMCDWKEKFLMHGVRPKKQLIMHWNSLAMLNYPSLCEGIPVQK